MKCQGMERDRKGLTRAQVALSRGRAGSTFRNISQLAAESKTSTGSEYCFRQSEKLDVVDVFQTLAELADNDQTRFLSTSSTSRFCSPD